MSEREPALLRDAAAASASPEAAEDGARDTVPTAAPAVRREVTDGPMRPVGRNVPTVHVVGFWKRLAAAAVDLGIIVPVSLLVTLVVSAITDVAMPPGGTIDHWIDLVVKREPALVMAFALFTAIGLTYLLVMHIVLGRTLGMRLLKMRIIDLYGDRPSPARCCARTAGYLAGAATLFLGFLWIGFDSEKRGLQDWIAGTLVIRA